MPAIKIVPQLKIGTGKLSDSSEGRMPFVEALQKSNSMKRRTAVKG